MASPREPTNGPTPISLSLSLSLFPAIGVSLQIPNRVSIGWFRRPISNQISNEIRLGRNFLNTSRHPRALYIYIFLFEQDSQILDIQEKESEIGNNARQR